MSLVRDEFEVKIPELEANLSSVMGCPWKTSIDPGYIYGLAEERYAKEAPGQMLTKYTHLHNPTTALDSRLQRSIYPSYISLSR